jgi:hypothetical protein
MTRIKANRFRYGGWDNFKEDTNREGKSSF